MIKHRFIQLALFLFFLSCPFSVAMALSTGTGTYNVSAGLTYTEGTLDFFPGKSSLEAWTIAKVNIPYKSAAEPYVSLDTQMYDVYGNASVPGWDTAPTDSAVSYGDSSVTITNDHTDAMNPEGKASLAMSTAGSPGKIINSSSNILYFANVIATGDGSFTFFVDYNAAMVGTTTSINDSVTLAASVSAAYYTMVYDDDGLLQWGNNGSTLEVDQDARWLKALDGNAIAIDDFTGQVALTVNYTSGDMFHLRFDGQSSIQGYSEDQQVLSSPVPEPSTILLLGSGLLGLAWYGRKRKKA